MVAAGTYADSVLQAKILSYAEGIAAGPFDLILTLVEDSQGIVIARMRVVWPSTSSPLRRVSH